MSDLGTFLIADAIGSAAFALNGFCVDMRKHLDYMGLFIVSLLIASGKDILSNVLLGRALHSF